MAPYRRDDWRSRRRGRRPLRRRGASRGSSAAGHGFLEGDGEIGAVVRVKGGSGGEGRRFRGKGKWWGLGTVERAENEGRREFWFGWMWREAGLWKITWFSDFVPIIFIYSILTQISLCLLQ